MAIVVMAVIIVLNIALLFMVMRVGTQGEHHAEFAADQSTAVMALYNKLGISTPESHEVAHHSPDVGATTEETVADDTTAE